MTEKANPHGRGGGCSGMSTAGDRLTAHHTTTDGQLQGPGRPVHSTDGRVCAYVYRDVLHKDVRRSVHLLRTPPAWAFDVCSLDEAAELGAQVVEVHDNETETLYRASLADVTEYGLPVNRGHGPQLALCLARWRTIGDGDHPTGGADPETEPQELQLSLFGAMNP